MMEIGTMPSDGESGPAGGFWSVKSRHDLFAESLAPYSQIPSKKPISSPIGKAHFHFFFQELMQTLPDVIPGMWRFVGDMCATTVDSRAVKG
jgi:hypothetical protein